MASKIAKAEISATQKVIRSAEARAELFLRLSIFLLGLNQCASEKVRFNGPVSLLFTSRSSFSFYLPLTILIRKSPSEAPVNFFNGALICDAIRKTQGFNLICNLRRPAKGGEWRFCRSVRRIERPAKSNKGERRKHGGNAAVNDVSSHSASCFYGGLSCHHSSSGFSGQGFQKSLGNSKRSV